jgi:hypothetical protein
LRPPAGVAAGFLLLALAIALSPSDVPAHDPSAFGGLFRTRNAGATWFVANPAGFLSGAIALAISPIDSNHLLLATDSGLLRSRNAGFALVSHDELLRQAVEGRRALQWLSLSTLAGGAAFLALLMLGGSWLCAGWRAIIGFRGTSPHLWGR